jgi:uncharacterized protein YndB with AHSA1/START domain
MSLMTTMTTTMPSDTELRFTRAFKAPRALVYEAFTSPALLPRWMIGPDGWVMTTCEVDLRVGGKFRYVWTKPGDKSMGMGGTFVEIDPPGRIVHLEVFDEDWTGGETRVTTELIERGGVTEMTLTVRYTSKDARDGAMKVGMASGMEMSYARLDEILANPSA